MDLSKLSLAEIEKLRRAVDAQTAKARDSMLKLLTQCDREIESVLELRDQVLAIRRKLEAQTASNGRIKRWQLSRLDLLDFIGRYPGSTRAEIIAAFAEHDWPDPQYALERTGRGIVRFHGWIDSALNASKREGKVKIAEGRYTLTAKGKKTIKS